MMSGQASHTQSQHPTHRCLSSQPIAKQRFAKNNSPSLPVDHDFVVQAANPAHPLHQKWLEAYGINTGAGSVARRRRSETAGSKNFILDSPQTRRKSSRATLADERSTAASGITPQAPLTATRLESSAPGWKSPSRAGVRRSQDGRLASAAGDGSLSSLSSGGEEAAASILLNSSQCSRSRTGTSATSFRSTESTAPRYSLTSMAPPVVNGASGGPDRDVRRRRKRRASRTRSSVKDRVRVPTPPLPPPRISSSVSHQASQNEQGKADDFEDMTFARPTAGALSVPSATTHAVKDGSTAAFAVAPPENHQSLRYSSYFRGIQKAATHVCEKTQQTPGRQAGLKDINSHQNDNTSQRLPAMTYASQDEKGAPIPSPTSTRFDLPASSHSQGYNAPEEAPSSPRGSSSATNGSACKNAGSQAALNSQLSLAALALEITSNGVATGRMIGYDSYSPQRSQSRLSSSDSAKNEAGLHSLAPQQVSISSLTGENNELSARRQRSTSLNLLRNGDYLADVPCFGTRGLDKTPSSVSSSFQAGLTGLTRASMKHPRVDTYLSSGNQSSVGAVGASTSSHSKLDSVLAPLKLGKTRSTRAKELFPAVERRQSDRAPPVESAPDTFDAYMRLFANDAAKGTQNMDLPQSSEANTSNDITLSPLPPSPQSFSRKPVPQAFAGGKSKDDGDGHWSHDSDAQQFSLAGEETEDAKEFFDAPENTWELALNWPVDQHRQQRGVPPWENRGHKTPGNSSSTPLPSAALQAPQKQHEWTGPNFVVKDTAAPSEVTHELTRTTSRCSSHSSLIYRAQNHRKNKEGPSPVFALPSANSSECASTTPATIGRRMRLASVWSRPAGRNKGRDGVSSPSPILAQSRQAVSLMSHGMSSSSIMTHSQSESFDISSSVGADHEAQNTMGLGIIAAESDATGTAHGRHARSNLSGKERPMPTRWRNRVPSLPSLKSAKEARPAQSRQHTASVLTSPTRTSPTGMSSSSRPKSFSRSRSVMANRSDDNKVRSSLPYIEPVSSGHVASKLPSSASKTMSFKNAVVAAGRKSFSRDRGNHLSSTSHLKTPGEDLPTIHKSLSPALLSESPERGLDAEQGSLTSASLKDAEPDDRHDFDIAFRASATACVSRKVSAAAKPSLNQIIEQDGSSESSRSHIYSAPNPSRSVQNPEAPTGHLSAASQHSMQSSLASDPPVVAPNRESSKSFLERRTSLGKGHVTPPTLKFSPPTEVFAPPHLDTMHSPTSCEQLRNSLSLSPSLSVCRPSSAEKRTPQSARALRSSATGTPPSFSLPSRTSFSMDRDRAPVASPYVQHASSPSPCSAALRNAFRKLAPGGSLGVGRRGAAALPNGKGISSEQFRGHGEDTTMDDEQREELRADEGDRRLRARGVLVRSANSSSSSLRPWSESLQSESLAAAEAATRMLAIESQTLQVSPSNSPTWPRTPTTKNRLDRNVAYGSGADQASLSTTGPDGEHERTVSPSSSAGSFVDRSTGFLPLTRGREISAGGMMTAMSASGSTRVGRLAGGDSIGSSSGFFPTSRPPTLRSAGGSSPPSPRPHLLSSSSIDSSVYCGGAGEASIGSMSSSKSPELDTLDLLLRQQKAREAEMFRNISARNRTPKLS